MSEERKLEWACKQIEHLLAEVARLQAAVIQLRQREIERGS